MLLIFTIIQILVALLIILFTLIQYNVGSQQGASFGAGASGAMKSTLPKMSSPAKITAVLAVIFFLNTLAMGIYISRFQGSTSDLAGELEKAAQQDLTNQPLDPLKPKEGKGPTKAPTNPSKAPLPELPN